VRLVVGGCRSRDGIDADRETGDLVLRHAQHGCGAVRMKADADDRDSRLRDRVLDNGDPIGE